MEGGRTYDKKGLFAFLVDTIRLGIDGSATLGESSLKFGSGLPSMFVSQDMFNYCTV